MIKLFKTFNLFFLIATVIISSSCLKNDEDNRTEEVERIEITNFVLVLEDNGTDVDTTASGMYYITHAEGTGTTPSPQDSVFIEYVGYFINGTIFDASALHHENGIWGFTYKDIALINGFDEAIGMMKTGGEATFIIPSKLAYGDRWYENIPPYTPLVFDINRYASNVKPDTNE